MGVAEILTIIFVILKIVGAVDWSWWLVFLPEIIAGGIYIGFLALHVILTVGAARHNRRLIKKILKEAGELE